MNVVKEKLDYKRVAYFAFVNEKKIDKKKIRQFSVSPKFRGLAFAPS